MNDYISREEAIKVLCDACGNAACPKGLIPRCSYYETMQAVPAADVRPVVRGKWIDMGDFISYSACNATRLKEFDSYYGKAKQLDARTDYCPNCGADMRKEADGNV